MKLPRLEDMNSDRFLKEAFCEEKNAEWIRAGRRRRNIYLWLFLTGLICVFITAITQQFFPCIISIFLSTASLVLKTKYDTRLYFLTRLKLRKPDEEDTDDL